MEEKIKKFVTIISLSIAAIVAICAILFAANQEKFGGLFDVAFWVLMCYIALSLIVWIFYGIKSVVKKPKKALVFIAVIAVVVIASVLLALGDTMPEDFLVRYNTSAGTAKLIAIACYITYFTVIGALVLMIYSAVSKGLKK